MQSKAVTTDVESNIEPRCSSDLPAAPQPESQRGRQVLRGPQKPKDPFDFERLRSTCGEQDSRMLRLLEIFSRETASDVADLKAAINSRDVDQITRLSHRLKGSAALLGAECLRKQAAMMESRGRRADLSGARVGLAGLLRESDRCRDFIEGLRTSLSC
jgi:HPt (histidine-containing phosphotransfer) domain-containing protein